MPDAGARVVGPAFLAASTATLYTVPALTVLTVRNIRINNETAAGVTATVCIGTDAAGKRLIGPGTIIPANTAYDWSGFMVLAAAEILTGFAGSASALTITVSGVLTT